MTSRPTVRLKRGIEHGLARGLPWVYERQVDWDDDTRGLAPGTIVDVLDSQGRGVATAAVDPAHTIALRCWAHQAGVAVDAALLTQRLGAALALRQRLFDTPWYRLIHADADGLPGVICDRFGDTLVVDLSASASGIEEPLIEALRSTTSPKSLQVRRGGENIWHGPELLEPVMLPEHGAHFPVDLTRGQKTGWYYDQRAHRAFAARCARGARVLDAFCYSGGFAIQAATAGATEVMAMDRSADALALAARAATLNGVADRVRCVRADVLEALPRLVTEAERFDLAIVDPPPLARRRDKRGVALQAHRHLARSAAGLLNPGGILIQASCSHAVAGERFLKSLLQGLRDAGRAGTLIHRGGAGPDHPLHPMLPQSAYLDVVGLRVV